MPNFYIQHKAITIDGNSSVYKPYTVFCNEGDLALGCGFNIPSTCRVHQNQPVWTGSIDNDLTGCMITVDNSSSSTADGSIYARCYSFD